MSFDFFKLMKQSRRAYRRAIKEEILAKKAAGQKLRKMSKNVQIQNMIDYGLWPIDYTKDHRLWTIKYRTIEKHERQPRRLGLRRANFKTLSR